MKHSKREVGRQLLLRAMACLRDRYDRRLAVLQTPDAGERLRSVMGHGATLGGKVIAGQSAAKE